MYPLRVPVFILAALVLLHCIAAAPNHRYFSPGSSNDEQENALPVKESRSLSKPLPDSIGQRPPIGFIAKNTLRFKKKYKG